MARALLRRNRQAEAIPWFDRALERRPQMLAAMREKGVTLASLGRTDEAAAILEKAANLYPKDDVLLTDLGDVFMQQNELDKAEDALQKAVAVNPERGEALNFLGLIAIRQGDEAGAEANFREAIRMRPDLPAPHDSLGWLLTGRRNLDEASREFQLALFYDDKDGEAHHGLGLLAILKHDRNTALLELKTAAGLRAGERTDAQHARGRPLGQRGIHGSRGGVSPRYRTRSIAVGWAPRPRNVADQDERTSFCCG